VADARRPEGPNTAVVDLPPSSPHQPPQNNQDPKLEAKVGNDQHQDSEEEIEAIIQDKLISLHQENERLQLEQEHMAR
jgi:hypothetical protein